jgi:hypothetical protein
MRRMWVMKGHRREYAGSGHGALWRANLRNAPRTSFFVNQVPCQMLFAESFEGSVCLVS